MQYVLTIFDYSKDPPLPLQTLVVSDQVKVYKLYQPGTGLKLRQIYETKDEIRRILKRPTMVNDFKTHVKAFDLREKTDYKIYDLNLPRLKTSNPRKTLVEVAKRVVKRKPEAWQRLVANSSVVYQYLEDKGLYHGYQRVFPKYSLATFSGRSKTSEFNLQGTTADFDLRHVEGYGYFVQFDWIGADILMAAHLSQDPEMLGSFKKSDPYTRISEMLGCEDFPRDRCKRDLMRAVYSLSVDDPVLELFPVFRKWMSARIEDMHRDGYLSSIMGRKFRLKGDNYLSVFNAQMQGSVAHAMQAVLVRLFGEYRQYLFAEVHDSVVLSCDQSDLKALLEDVGEIVINPLEGLVENPPIMPVKISVGKKWRKWKRFRELRESKVNNG